MHLVDTHVHINFDVFAADLDQLQHRWQQAGVVQLVHSCVKPEEFGQIQALADRFPELFFAVGLHPLDAADWQGNTAEQILAYAKADPRVVAIGEMGLDFFKADNRGHQIEVFQAQLAIARELAKPVIIHCRDAADTMRQVLTEFQQEQGPVGGVMHCWGGNPEETQWFLDLGFYISFSGTVTFKKAEGIQASAQMVPLDRLLVETDCPFLAPVPKRGKRNEPAFVRHVAEAIAALRHISLETLAEQTTANARNLFKLPVPA
ncbi:MULTISPECIES: TatD family hydrolase [unclassified Synechocystis]|uniref:TatD family hydrolase n=1 Tax=unclassified Synechocystis TaxID=2640012 RepID=UPI00042800FC|nr:MULTISPECIES: TatD family hydrolase [unclassified Synechocystis]AIE75135.1 Putative deoxyribonuclease YcfH [Synechocystis sp. PCC 6714]MCT0252899.1 TatD family hydrolase [Synechocystis sp. CS-94]